MTSSNLKKEKFHKHISSPIGNITLVANEKSLTHVIWGKKNIGKNSPQHSVLKLAETQLHEYFSGKRTKFSLPLTLEGTTFQKKAWAALKKIPYGTTVSYKEQASKLGNANASRAVGSANGKNPLPIIIPCHRVITSSGSLGGFSGGLSKKVLLLKTEGTAA